MAGVERIELGVSGQLSSLYIYIERKRGSQSQRKEEGRMSREAETKDKDGLSPYYNGSLMAFQFLLPCP